MNSALRPGRPGLRKAPGHQCGADDADHGADGGDEDRVEDAALHIGVLQENAPDLEGEAPGYDGQPAHARHLCRLGQRDGEQVEDRLDRDDDEQQQRRNDDRIFDAFDRGLA
ncbi:hypothetical protein [Ensifer canadensis]